MKHIVASLVLAVLAGTSIGQDVVDSMVYDKEVEWKVFSSDGPIARFTVQGNSIWQATDEKVMVVDRKTNKHRSLSTLGSLPASGVTDMATDASGNVWIGTEAGLAMATGSSFKVFTKDNGLCADGVTALLATSDGKVWVGTPEGLCVYGGGAWKAYTKESGLRSNQVKALSIGPGKSIWVGTNFGISILKGGTWSSQSMDNEMSWNDVKALAYDSRKNRMWAAVGDKDVNMWDGKAWKVYMAVREGITCIMVDTQSRVWFGSSTGLMKFNGEEWITDQKRLTVPATLVTQMRKDSKGNLWFASENGVVFMSNPYPF